MSSAAASSGLDSNVTIFVQRAPGGQWEERLLLAPASSQSWVTANPTLRVSIEKIKDFNQVLIGGPRGGAPRELLGLAVLRFKKEDLKTERSRLLMEGSAVARLERIRLVREAGGDVQGVSRDRRVTGKSPGPLRFDAGINPRPGPREPYIGDEITRTLAERANTAGDVWVAMETCGDFKPGDIVNLPLTTDNGGRAHLLVRDRGLAQLTGRRPDAGDRASRRHLGAGPAHRSQRWHASGARPRRSPHAARPL